MLFDSGFNRQTHQLAESCKTKWQPVLNALADIAKVPSALIMKVDPPFMEVFCSSQSPNNPYLVGNREYWTGLYCEEVLRTQSRLQVPNALKSEKWKNNPGIKLGMISYLGYPLVLPDGKVCGTLCILDSRENSYNREVENLMTSLVCMIEDQVWLEVENEKHSESNSRLKGNDVYLRKLLNNMLDGLITIDQSGVIQSMNPAGEKIFGYASSDVYGKNISELMPEPYKSEHDQFLRNYFATGKGPIIGIEREVEGMRKNGEIFPMDLAVSELSFLGKRMFLGIVRDITERKKLEEEAFEARKEAEKANRNKSKFLARMNHELRTSLNSIMGFSNLILTQARSLNDSAVKSIRHIKDSGKHLLDLVEDILDLSRIEAGEMRVNIGSVHIGSLVEAVGSHSGMIKGDEIDYRDETSGFHDNLVMADPLRLKQVLFNLISNAVKYNCPGGSIVFSVKEKKERILFKVKDTGIGIPANRLGEIFQPFNRLGAEDSEVQGMGIGLALSRELTELMGGRLEVKSVEGKGSEFTVDLPAADEGKSTS